MLKSEKAMSERERSHLTNADKQEEDLFDERRAYFDSLHQWIHQARLYQNFSTCFPYYMMSFQAVQSNVNTVPLINNNYQIPAQQWPFHVPYPPNNAIRNQNNRGLDDANSHAEVIRRHGGYEYIIPPLYKRLAAEFIDFILLFVVKLIITFIAVDVFDFIDLEKFDLSKLSENLDDYQTAIELTSEILVLEFMYRVLVCLFEAWCVVRCQGATPGKALVGLRVVSAAAVVSAGRADAALLFPGGPPSPGAALARSMLKNLLISLLFPLCFVLFVFRFNRTGYDLLCNVMVVEESMYPPRRHNP